MSSAELNELVSAIDTSGIARRASGTRMVYQYIADLSDDMVRLTEIAASADPDAAVELTLRGFKVTAYGGTITITM